MKQSHETPPTREEILDAAQSYLNTPFRFGGRSKRGMDCIGIPLVLARDLRVEGWRVLWNDKTCHAYPQVRPVGFLRAKLDGFAEQGILRRVDVNRLETADMVLRWGGFGHDHHVSLIGTGDWIIEASNRQEARYKNGRVLRKRVLPEERARSFLGGYQFAGVV